MGCSQMAALCERSLAILAPQVGEEARAGPLLVHGGSGAGHCGCFIALCDCLGALRARGEVDLLGTVNHLHRYREKLVQSAAQYRFLYGAVARYLETVGRVVRRAAGTLPPFCVAVSEGAPRSHLTLPLIRARCSWPRDWPGSDGLHPTRPCCLASRSSTKVSGPRLGEGRWNLRETASMPPCSLWQTRG